LKPSNLSHFCGLVAVATTLLVAPRASAEGASLRLRDAIRLALVQNERSLQAGQRVEAAEGTVARSRAGFLPSITLGASATKQLETDRPNQPTVTSSGTLTVTQPLLNPGAFPSYWQSKHLREAERAGAKDTRRVLAFDTARAFLQALTTEQVRISAEQRLERAKANLQNAEARAEAQLASVNDATRARLDMTSALQGVASSTGNEKRARFSLAFLVGGPVEGTLEPPENTTRSAETFGEGPKGLAESAASRRPDILALHERALAARDSAKDPKYRYAPSLNLSGQVRVTPDDNAVRWHNETISLSLNWTIWDGGVRGADVRSREAQAEISRLDERLARRSVDRDVQTNIALLEAARDSYAAARDAVDVARKGVEEANILYKQGLGRAIELVDANAKLFDAEVSVATAKLQMEQAYLEVRYALGLDPLDDLGAPVR
jgi:outer membrane protein TolC